MTTRSGKLRNNESFVNMIENLGDAYEAAEECYGMVHYLADIIAREWGQPQQGVIAEAVANYKTGLSIGGVQRER
jgi:hypothetical protein